MEDLFGEKGPADNGAEKREHKEPESFEAALEELEQIVAKLDSGELPLEESVTMFERAQFLVQWCQSKLDKIEGKLKLLVPDGEGGFLLEDVDDIGG